MNVIVVFSIPFSLIHVKLSKNEHLHLQMDIHHVCSLA
jgi:hypothetical protein